MLHRISLVINLEIKKREIAVSVILVLLMMVVGVFISDKISDYITTKNETFTTATQIEDPSQFNYAIQTDFGNVLAYGTISANNPVSYPDLEGQYTYIEKVTEKYTMHTRTVTTSVNGKTRTRVETYWTWDRVGSEDKQSDSVTFMSVSFPLQKFTLHSKFSEAGYISDGYHLRHYYNVIPSDNTGTVLTSIQNKTIPDGNKFFIGQNPSEVVESAISNEDVPIVLFWTFWILASGAVIWGFIYCENMWLDD